MTPRRPADAPDGPSSSTWMLARSRQGMPPSWSPSASSSACPPAPALVPPQLDREGQPSAKRLRIEIPSTPPSSPHRARRPQRPSLRTSQRNRRLGETRDTGIVSATEPGPSSGSLLRPPRLSSASSLPVSPIDPCSLSPHIPPHQPPINRETLKELDLDAILRNPQLRHDLLFDSGLQFRPTSSRRKRDLADQYWLAIVRELETGCTCTTIDVHGKLAELRCACDSKTLEKPIVRYNAGGMATVRTHSRIRPLLNELLEVLISIIQPPQPPTLRPPELVFPPPPQHPQFQQNLVHIALLRQHLDPDLIQQEVNHGLFDPSGLFQVIGDIIRCHCAPMRDAAVDQMVALARSCAPGGNGTKLDAVRAIRMCFEIMELMKLDVANHQLQTLRPYLVRTAGDYEVQIFSDERHNARRTVRKTREWLGSAWKELSSGDSPQSQLFLSSSRPTQVVMAVVKATVNLIFDPPPPGAPSPPASSTSTPIATTPPTSSSSSHSRPSSRPSSSSHAEYYAGYPETFYLDYGRFGTLNTDAADFTALYMLLMMYRQLVHSPLNRDPRSRAEAVAPDALVQLKKEIWEIGPAHPGLCFMQGRRPGSCSLGSSRSSASAAGSSGSGSGSGHSRHERDREAEMRRWRAEIEDVALQVAMHASEPRRAGGSLAKAKEEADAAAAAAAAAATAATQEGERTLHAPDMQVVKFALGWTASNLKHGSPFSVLCRKRLRERVEEAVLAIVLPQLAPTSASQPTTTASDPASTSAATSTDAKDAAPSPSSGLEPLSAEIKHISQRAAKLVEIHMNVYGELYAHPAFLDKDVLPSSTLLASGTTSTSSNAMES
ncbi:T-complex protein 11-domain-containing protein [Trametes polyzona]|nr:T-complex protein 11-domain-containing protein [Trametes polyzona]